MQEACQTMRQPRFLCNIFIISRLQPCGGVCEFGARRFDGVFSAVLVVFGQVPEAHLKGLGS
jgi:hypothetical protein